MDALCQEEALYRTDNARFVEAAFARASIMDADDFLRHELTENSISLAPQQFTLKQKLSKWMTAVRQFKSAPSSRRAQFPSLALAEHAKSEPQAKLPVALKTIRILDEKMCTYSFGSSYIQIAKFHNLLGLQAFCKWCTDQSIAMAHFLTKAKADYEVVCKACSRHPDTPHLERSWDPTLEATK